MDVRFACQDGLGRIAPSTAHCHPRQTPTITSAIAKGTRSVTRPGLVQIAPGTVSQKRGVTNAMSMAIKCVYVDGPVPSARAVRAVGMGQIAQNTVCQNPYTIDVTVKETKCAKRTGSDKIALNTVSRRKGIISVRREREFVCQGGLKESATRIAPRGRRKLPDTLPVTMMETKFVAPDGMGPSVILIVNHTMMTSTDITLVTSTGIRFVFQDGTDPSALSIVFHRVRTTPGITNVTSTGIKSEKTCTIFQTVTRTFKYVTEAAIKEYLSILKNKMYILNGYISQYIRIY